MLDAGRVLEREEGGEYACAVECFERRTGLGHGVLEGQATNNESELVPGWIIG